ncbi:MAG: DUF4537 domain-containing protein [Fimbriimonadaceae bacterium]|nr:DUF4537 domain-containing protein [Fimbriimonadaceae bacterium]
MDLLPLPPATFDYPVVLCGGPPAGAIALVPDWPTVRAAGATPAEALEGALQQLAAAIAETLQAGGRVPPASRPETLAPLPTGPGAPPADWVAGDRVLCQWSHDLFWYPATVRQAAPGRVYVKFDDGDKEWTVPERVMPLDLEVGDRVYCRWQGGDEYYPGQVSLAEGSERIHVVYDDGDQEWTTVGFCRLTR